MRAEIEAMGGRALVCLADITDEAAVARMFAEIGERFGRLDILVNNAADRGIVPFEQMTTAQWRHIVGIALEGNFFCTRAAIPYMLRGGWGRVVNISGVSHYAPSYTGRAHVSAAKAGAGGHDPRARRGVREAEHHCELRLPRPGRRRALRDLERAARPRPACRRSATSACPRTSRGRCIISACRDRASSPGTRCT